MQKEKCLQVVSLMIAQLKISLNLIVNNKRINFIVMKLLTSFHKVCCTKSKRTLLNQHFLSILSPRHQLTQTRFAFSQTKQNDTSDVAIPAQQTHLVVEQGTKLPQKSQFQMYPIQRYEVGQRLDRYLKNTSLNWALAQKFLRNKQIFILNSQGQKVKQNSYRLQWGDTMYIKYNIASQMFAKKQSIASLVNYDNAKEKIDELVIFDNRNITILNKPSNYSVQGGDDYEKNLFSLMAARYKREMVHVIHRLDKPTTGVLFFCKNLKTAQLIQAAIQSRRDYNKYYLALTTGPKIPQQEEYIRCNIEWTNKHKARIIDSLQKEDSKDSITYYKKLYSKELTPQGESLNMLGIKLITGRKHQIRCHLSDYLNNPVLNDKKYGATLLKHQNNQTLNEKDNAQNKQKDDQGFIFLHALMTIIKSDQIATDVFEVTPESLFQSRKSDSVQIIENNANGAILLKNGEIKIIGNLPKHWKNISKHSHESTNNPNLKQIVLNYNLNEIQMGEEIERSETNLWKRHRPQKKVMTIT